MYEGAETESHDASLDAASAHAGDTSRAQSTCLTATHDSATWDGGDRAVAWNSRASALGNRLDELLSSVQVLKPTPAAPGARTGTRCSASPIVKLLPTPPRGDGDEGRRASAPVFSAAFEHCCKEPPRRMQAAGGANTGSLTARDAHRPTAMRRSCFGAVGGGATEAPLSARRPDKDSELFMTPVRPPRNSTTSVSTSAWSRPQRRATVKP